MEPPSKQPKPFRLFARKQEQAETEAFARAAQNALDAANESRSKAASGRGSLYRTGLTLAELKPGECGTIRFLIGSTQGRLRLLEMGMTPGTHVKVLRIAAFGGPLDVLVRGYQLSLRRDEAAAIWLGEEDDEEPK
jgi:ferrous iron transport protein A